MGPIWGPMSAPWSLLRVSGYGCEWLTVMLFLTRRVSKQQHIFTQNQYFVHVDQRVFAIWNIGKRGPGKIKIYTSQLNGLSHYRYINGPSSAKTHWLYEQLVRIYIIGKHHRDSHICLLKIYVTIALNNDVLPIRWETIAKSEFYYWQMVSYEQHSIKLRWFLIKKVRNLSSVIYWPFHSGLNVLTHLLLNKMAATLQTAFWNVFSWIKILEFIFNFHCSLFLRVQLTISQLCFR